MPVAAEAKEPAKTDEADDGKKTRSTTPGTERLFINAVVYGPGMGATPPIDL